jgi:hypothetical protein
LLHKSDAASGRLGITVHAPIAQKQETWKKQSMGGENLQELVKRQAKIISALTEANKKLEARVAGLEALAR